MKPETPGNVSLLPDTLAFFPPNTVFVRYGTHGDGTCFFHSVCASRNEHNYLHVPGDVQKRIGRQFRRDFTKHVTDAVWDAFQQKNDSNEETVTAEKARHNFRDTKLWANQSMIQFVASVMKLNLLFIDETNSSIYCGVHGDPYDPMIIILWVNRSHFEPVGMCRGLRGDTTGVQFVFDHKKDADVVDHVMGVYMGNCSV